MATNPIIIHLEGHEALGPTSHPGWWPRSRSGCRMASRASSEKQRRKAYLLLSSSSLLPPASYRLPLYLLPPTASLLPPSARVSKPPKGYLARLAACIYTPPGSPAGLFGGSYSYMLGPPPTQATGKQQGPKTRQKTRRPRLRAKTSGSDRLCDGEGSPTPTPVEREQRDRGRGPREEKSECGSLLRCPVTPCCLCHS